MRDRRYRSSEETKPHHANCDVEYTLEDGAVKVECDAGLKKMLGEKTVLDYMFPDADRESQIMKAVKRISDTISEDDLQVRLNDVWDILHNPTTIFERQEVFQKAKDRHRELKANYEYDQLRTMSKVPPDHTEQPWLANNLMVYQFWSLLLNHKDLDPENPMLHFKWTGEPVKDGILLVESQDDGTFTTNDLGELAGLIGTAKLSFEVQKPYTVVQKEGARTNPVLRLSNSGVTAVHDVTTATTHQILDFCKRLTTGGHIFHLTTDDMILVTIKDKKELYLHPSVQSFHDDGADRPWIHNVPHNAPVTEQDKAVNLQMIALHYINPEWTTLYEWQRDEWMQSFKIKEGVWTGNRAKAYLTETEKLALMKVLGIESEEPLKLFMQEKRGNYQKTMAATYKDNSPKNALVID